MQVKSPVFVIGSELPGIIAQSSHTQCAHVHVSYRHGDLFLSNLLLADGR